MFYLQAFDEGEEVLGACALLLANLPVQVQYPGASSHSCARPREEPAMSLRCSDRRIAGGRARSSRRCGSATWC